MTRRTSFNYIITIHNKEDLIEKVMMCVLMCCRDHSHVYPVLDGCTDQTEKIVDNIVNTFAGIPITKVHTPDVHELRSINAGLGVASQEGHGYNIVLQDDVLLADFMLEKKIIALYDWAGPRLGYVSFRLGANFSRDAASSGEAVPYTEYIENAYGHGIPQAKMLLPGHIAYRTVPIKSPVCIPFELIRSVGTFEEQLAPYGHDDPEYAIRLKKAGYRNAVFAIRFYSDIKWGGTRTTPHPKLGDIIKRNMNLIRQWHGSALADICEHSQDNEIVEVPNMVSQEENQRAIKLWESSCKQLEEFQSLKQSRVSGTIKSVIRRSLELTRSRSAR